MIIADEPTTALDATIQAQILDLLIALRAETGMGNASYRLKAELVSPFKR